MPEVTLEGIARSQLSVEQNHALDILVNLPTDRFNYLKLSILELDIPGVVAPATLEKFLEFCQKHDFDLSEAGVSEFKNSRNLGNTGLLRGVIGPQTAVAYYTAIVGKLTLSVASISDTRSINQAGIDLVKEFEGLHDILPDGRIKAYFDPVNVVTIGWGHTEEVSFGDIISVAEAEAFLKQDLEEAGKDVSKYVQVSLTDNQFAALTSFVFNVGSTAFAESTMRGLLNEEKYQGAADQFTRWVHGTVGDKKVVLQGLVRRREAEQALFLS